MKKDTNRLTTVRCPRCGAQAPWQNNPHRPFCSERCRLIDLGRWADEEYRIPAERAPEDDPDKIIELPQKKH